MVRRDPRALRALRNSFPMEVATERGRRPARPGLRRRHRRLPPHPPPRACGGRAAAGAHVLLEKPMTVRPDDARAVARTAESEGRVVSLAYGWNYRRSGCGPRRSRSPARSATCGRSTATWPRPSSTCSPARAATAWSRSTATTSRRTPDTWARPNSGGGYLYGQVSHQLGLALLLVRSEPELVYAQMNLLPSGVDIDVAVTVRFADGVLGTFTGHGRLPWGTRYPFGFQLAGENGVMTLDFERERADANLVRRSQRRCRGRARRVRGHQPRPVARRRKRRRHLLVRGSGAVPGRPLQRARPGRPGAG